MTLTKEAAQLLDDLCRINIAKRARIRALNSQINDLHSKQLEVEKLWMERNREYPAANVFDSYREQREFKRRDMNQLAYEIASLHAEDGLMIERPATDVECREILKQVIEEEI